MPLSVCTNAVRYRKTKSGTKRASRTVKNAAKFVGVKKGSRRVDGWNVIGCWPSLHRNRTAMSATNIDRLRAPPAVASLPRPPLCVPFLGEGDGMSQLKSDIDI